MLLFIIYSKSSLLLNLDTFADVPSFFSYCFLTFMPPLSSLLLLHFYLLDILFPVNYVRKLPWLSRQSDRLLTDRSLVRSQAEAPFLLFLLTSLYSRYTKILRTKSTPPVGLEPTTARLRAARSTD